MFPGPLGISLLGKALSNNLWSLAVRDIRDHGLGVAPQTLANLTKPFFRGDAARTAAMGAGLGLSIVERNLQRMGGSMELANSSSGGLAAHIRLKMAPRF